MSRKLLVTLLSAASIGGIALASGTASADLIGVNFVVQGTNVANNSLSATSTAGFIPQENFNNVTSPATLGTAGTSNDFGPINNLVDSTGTATNVSISGVFNNNYQTGTHPVNGPNYALLYGEFKTGKSSSASVTLSGLGSGSYNLVVYTVADFFDVSSITGTFSVGSDSQTVLEQEGANFNGTFVKATDNTPGNYIEFTNITPVSGDITLNISSVGGSNVGVDGIQLQTVPEPASVGIFGAGAAGLMLLSRRRRALK
jgi:hypothetical protein